MFSKKKLNIVEEVEPKVTVVSKQDPIDMEAIHRKKLIEISSGYSYEDAEIMCSVFARKYPEVMYEALSKEHQNMYLLIKSLNTLNSSYLEKVGEEV